LATNLGRPSVAFDVPSKFDEAALTIIYDRMASPNRSTIQLKPDRRAFRPSYFFENFRGPEVEDADRVALEVFPGYHDGAGGAVSPPPQDDEISLSY
jgi:hypothetical protein